MHKCAYNYTRTYICKCDSLIIGKFGSSLYFVKKKNLLLYEARCSSDNTDHVSEFNSSVLPSVKSSNVDKYWSLDLSLSQQIRTLSAHIKHRNTSFYHATFNLYHSQLLSHYFIHYFLTNHLLFSRNKLILLLEPHIMWISTKIFKD
jgi:hypothetical protein